MVSNTLFMKLQIRLFVGTTIFIASSIIAHDQFVDGTKGLFCIPSAEFEEDATFTITNNFLSKQFLPPYKEYERDKKGTFGYVFSVTLWCRLEIAYVYTLIDSHSPVSCSAYY